MNSVVSILKEELMMEQLAKHNEKWICLECWKKLVAKPGDTPPFPSKRMICDECGARKVLVTNVRAEILYHSSK